MSLVKIDRFGKRKPNVRNRLSGCESKTFIIQTNGPRLYELTDRIARWVQGNGLVNLFVQHSSASLLIQENADKDVRSDLTAFFDRLVPPATHPSMSYLTHRYEGADDMPAHIKAALLPTFLTIPLHEGQLALGTWQGIYLVEHRAAPHQRRVIASVLCD